MSADCPVQGYLRTFTYTDNCGANLAYDVVKVGALIEPQNVWIKSGGCVGQQANATLQYYNVEQVMPPSTFVAAPIVKDP